MSGNPCLQFGVCVRHSTCDEENLACEMASLIFLHMQVYDGSTGKVTSYPSTLSPCYTPSLAISFLFYYTRTLLSVCSLPYTFFVNRVSFVTTLSPIIIVLKSNNFLGGFCSSWLEI